MARCLTSKFGTYRLAQYEKKTGKGVMDIIDIGNFEISKIAMLIKLGSPEIPMDDNERAYEKLDTYLSASENNSILTAYFDLIDDLNRDLKMFAGVDMSKMKDRMVAEMSKMKDKIEGALEGDVEENISPVSDESK